MSRHRSKHSWENGFVKPNGQCWACSGIVMARNGRMKSNEWFRCIDNHTPCISNQGLSLLQMRVWSQIAPLLKKFLQKEWVSQILLLPLPCQIRVLLVFYLQHYDKWNYWNGKILSNFLLLRCLKRSIYNSVAEVRVKFLRSKWLGTSAKTSWCIADYHLMKVACYN